MSQLNEVDPSNIDTLYLTGDGTITGVPVRAVWKEADWSPLRRTAKAAIGGAEVQEVDMGGSSGVENCPVTLEIEHCTDILYGGLKTRRDMSATTFAATIKLEATDAAHAKRSVTFTKLRILDLTYKTGERFGSGIYPGVVVSCMSEE